MHIHVICMLIHVHVYTFSLQLFKALFGKYVEDTSSMMYGIIAVAALLLRKGADIHQTNKNGRSANNFLPFLGTLMTVLADYEEVM